jgi:autotransporter-associated beta strand protein
VSPYRLIAICWLLIYPCAARGAVVAVSELKDSIIDSRGMTLGNSVADYGTAVNGESFEDSTIIAYGGYEYTAYWVMDTSSGTSYHVAVARRSDNGTTFGAWQVCNLPNAQFVNGLSGGVPADAHNVVSMGIDQNNGTIFLAYDMHDDPLKLMQTSVGAANSATWSNSSASLFGNQTSSLGSTSLAGSSLTYPMFVQTPSGNEQLFIREGASGGGSWFLFNYTGSANSWDSGHQIDNGFAGTYQGNTQRNAYPNGFSYNSQGQLIETFVWRETASSSNHDINYVASNDGGATWINNAGLVISSTTGNPSLTFSLTSSGLAVVSISQSSSLMNQQCQAADNNGNIHCIDYSLDPSKSPVVRGSDLPWDAADCTYYQYWRDSLGDWHRDKIPGSISTIYSTRPKLFFDSSDNAIAIYCTNNGPGGTLVIAEASAASNWTDWQTVYTTGGAAGGYFSEAQADASELDSKSILTVVMQDNPASSAAASAIHSLDFSIVLTPAGTTAFTAANSNWNTPGNWSGGAVPTGNTTALIGGGGTASISQTVPSVGGDVAIGTGGGNGTLNVSGGSLNVVNTISVGRDGGAVGTYNQTGGTVSASRFVVGDFYSTTSGGGASTATVSGGSLTMGGLQVAVSDGTSSSGSSFVVTGSARVNDTGDAIVGDCGNTGSVIVNGGTLSIAGNLTQGLNGACTTIVKLNGGALTLAGNTLAATQLSVSAGVLTANSATLVVANNAGQNATASISGGSVTASNLFIGNAANAGAVFQTGGTVSLTLAANTNDLAVGSSTSGAGYYKLSGGVLNTNEIDVGGNAANTVGVVDVTGGTVNDSGWITIGRGTGASSGVLNVTGGLVYFGTANAAQPLSLGWASTGSQAVLNVGGGTGGASVFGPSNASTSGNYGLNMNDSTNLPAILTVANLLSGGTLTVNQVASSHSTATSLLNFNGGTLKATAANAGASFLNATTGPDTIKGVYIYPGGATIDDSGTAITVANSLLAPNGAGVYTISVANGGSGYVGAPMVMFGGGSGTGGATAVANMVSDGSGNGTYKVASITITNPGVYTVGPSSVTLAGGGPTTPASGFSISTSANAGGGLTVVGGGTLTLSGSNNYSGATTIESGILKLANLAALGAGALVAAGGTLDLDGYSPTVAGLDGAAGVVANSFSTLATLTVNQLPGTSSFSGSIVNGAGNGTDLVALELSGSGRLVLSGTNTFTGGTEVTGNATLVLDDGSALASGSNLIVTSGVFFAPEVAAGAVSGPPTTAVPEPGTLALLAAGVTAMAAAGTPRRRSRTKTTPCP